LPASRTKKTLAWVVPNHSKAFSLRDGAIAYTTAP